MKLKINCHFQPAGDQTEAIKKLVEGVKNDKQHQVLLGATGTGKTFTVANVLAETNKSAIVLSHNKTLAGQLYSELKSLFPNNRVEYFISNFDFYRPEAYLPTSDVYVDKLSKSNQDIEAMRVDTINALLSKEPVIVVASVASIYGQINPAEYKKMALYIEIGQKISKKKLFDDLVIRNYKNNPLDLKPGTFRSKGDVIEIFPYAFLNQFYLRISLFADEIDGIQQLDALNNRSNRSLKN